MKIGYGDDRPVQYPAFWFDPADHPDEPVFVVAAQGDNSSGLVTLGWVREQMEDNHLEGRPPMWTHIMIRKPGDDQFWTCVPQIEPGRDGGAGILRFVTDDGDYMVEL